MIDIYQMNRNRFKVEFNVKTFISKTSKFYVYSSSWLYRVSSNFVKLRELDYLNPPLVDVQWQYDEEGCNKDHEPKVASSENDTVRCLVCPGFSNDLSKPEGEGQHRDRKQGPADQVDSKVAHINYDSEMM